MVKTDVSVTSKCTVMIWRSSVWTPSRVKLGVHCTSVRSHTWIKNIYFNHFTHYAQSYFLQHRLVHPNFAQGKTVSKAIQGLKLVCSCSKTGRRPWKTTVLKLGNSCKCRYISSPPRPRHTRAPQETFYIPHSPPTSVNDSPQLS